MSSSPEPEKVKSKRKRDIVPEDDEDKLEIDVNLPEPPSKKAKRKEKKSSKSKPSKEPTNDNAGEEQVKTKKDGSAADGKPKPASASEPAKRSEYGIWVGNLPFTATKDSLRRFLLNEGGINEEQVTRLHLPPGEKGQNKGFAYIDFASPAILETALGLSERMVEGRSVLIKNAKSFEGRPQKSAAEENSAGNVSKKEPSKRIFVGNLSFDATKEELAEHFAQAGEVEDVFVATFQDSGKCKGFAWVRFDDIEAAKVAVRGFIYRKHIDDDTEDEDEEDVIDGDEDKSNEKKRKPRKPMKWFINRLHGRPLRCEFAEDAQTRYKKRFNKGGQQSNSTVEDAAVEGADESVESLARQAAAARESMAKGKDPKMKKLDKDQRQEVRRKKHDARMIAPGKALANTQRASGAIVASKGSKVTFD